MSCFRGFGISNSFQLYQEQTALKIWSLTSQPGYICHIFNCILSCLAVSSHYDTKELERGMFDIAFSEHD